VESNANAQAREEEEELNRLQGEIRTVLEALKEVDWPSGAEEEWGREGPFRRAAASDQAGSESRSALAPPSTDRLDRLKAEVAARRRDRASAYEALKAARAKVVNAEERARTAGAVLAASKTLDVHVEHARRLADEAEEAASDAARRVESARKRFYEFGTVTREQQLDSIRKNPAYRDITIEPVHCAAENGRGNAAMLFEVDASTSTSRLTVTDCRPVEERRNHEYASPPNYRATLAVDSLVEPELFEDTFAQLLIANSEGRVLYSSAPRFGHFESLPFVGEAASPEQEASATQTPASGAQRRESNGGESRARAALHSFVRGLEVGGRSALLFIRPLRLPLKPARMRDGSDEDAGVWYLCGIVDQDAFASRVRAVPPTFSGFVILAFVLGLLSWPFLKIWYMSPLERLRPADMHFLVASLILASGLVTIVLQNAATYVSLRTRLDATAQRIAADIDRQFRAEVAGLIDGIEKAGPVICGLQGGSRPLEEDGERNLLYPAFDTAFLVDDLGFQVDKQFTYREAETQPADVSPRSYFRRAKLGPLWWYDHDEPTTNGNGRRSPFFLERIETYDHGWKLSTLSMPYEDERCGARVAASVGRMQTFWATVLPPAFAFAVIEDETGKTLFHSNDRRSLIEDFFLEVDQNERIRAAVRMRHQDLITGRYEGRGHRFYVSPLPFVPWSLVVLYDVEIPEAMNFGLGLVASTHLFLYTMLFGLAALAATLFVGDTRWSWLWPQWRMEQRYRWILAWMVVLGLYYATAILCLEAYWLALVILTVPVLLVAFLYRAFKPKVRTQRWRRPVATVASLLAAFFLCLALAGFRTADATQAAFAAACLLVCAVIATVVLRQQRAWEKRWEEQRHEEGGRLGPSRSFERSYLLALMGAVLLLAVFPAVAVFRDAFRLHAEQIVKFAQLDTARAFERRFREIQTDAARLRPQDPHFRRYDPQPVTLASECRGIYAYSSIFVAAGASRAAGDDDCWKPWRSMAAEEMPAGSAGDRRAAPLEEEHERVLWKRFTAWVSMFFSGYRKAGWDLRNVLFEEASDGAWAWNDRRREERFGDGVRAALEQTWGRSAADQNGGRENWCGQLDRAREQCDGGAGEEVAFCMTGKGFDRQGDLRLYQMGRVDLDLDRPANLREWLVVALTVLICLVLLYKVLRSLCVRVLGLQISDFPRLKLVRDDPCDWLRECRVLVRPSYRLVREILDTAKEGIAASALEVKTLPLPPHQQQVWLDEIRARPPRVLILQSFESGLSDREWRSGVLDTLEHLVFEKGTKVLLFCEISPLFRLISPSSYPDSADEPPPSADESLRWSKLLSVFVRDRDLPEREGGWAAIADRVEARLARECDASPELHGIKASVEALDEYPGRLTEDQVIETVGDLAGPYYRKAWILCTKEERLLLRHMAEGNLVNPRNTDVVERLLRRGLIRREPDFRLMNESFARFVLTAEPHERIAAWEREAEDSTWATLRIPVLIALALSAAFVVYAGRETFDATIGVVAAVFTGLPVLLRALASVRTQRAASSSGT
jgi:hypothetical protein